MLFALSRREAEEKHNLSIKPSSLQLVALQASASLCIEPCASLVYPVLTSAARLFLKEQLGCYWQQVVAV